MQDYQVKFRQMLITATKSTLKIFAKNEPKKAAFKHQILYHNFFRLFFIIESNFFFHKNQKELIGDRKSLIWQKAKYCKQIKFFSEIFFVKFFFCVFF